MAIISVIIPTYKRSGFICDAIDSVLNQTVKDIDIIVVDDNGKGTEEQLENQKRLLKYCEAGHINYVAHDTNRNGSVARNTGIQASDSKYISFLDDDDFYEPEKLEKQLLQMEIEGTSACLCGFTRRFSESSISSTPQKADIIISNILRNKVDTCAGSCLVVERKIIDEMHGFDESFERQQDAEFLIRLLQKAKISVVETSLVNIRMHTQNLKTPNLEKTIKQRMHFLETFKEIIQAYPPRIAKEIYDMQYIEIAKVSVKNRDIRKAFMWIDKTSNPLKSFIHISKNAVSYLIKKR